MNRVEVRAGVMSCTLCSLHRSSNGPVPFRGPDRPRLAIVAEAPGKVEDVAKKPLVGPSGKKLSEWLDRAKIDQSEVAFLNAVSCYPNRTPSSQEVELCRTNLISQLSFLSPEFVLVMGGVALSSFWSSLRMGDARGIWWKMTSIPSAPWSIATYHPAAVLRNGSLDGLVIRDVMQVRLAMTLGRPSSTHPSATCVQCGEMITSTTGRIRMMDGEDVSDKVKDGGLTWCEKHDGLRMGTKGQGRTKKESNTGRGTSSSTSPRKRGARSTKPSTGSTDERQTSINIEKYRVK